MFVLYCISEDQRPPEAAQRQRFRLINFCSTQNPFCRRTVPIKWIQTLNVSSVNKVFLNIEQNKIPYLCGDFQNKILLPYKISV